MSMLVLGWFASGLIGSALSLEFFLRRGARPDDVTVGDLALGAGLAMFGPINLAVGLLFFGGWCVRGLMDTDRVVFRRKAKP